MSEAAKIKALYNARILELAEDIPLEGRLDDPDATTSVRSPLCGSRITVDLKLKDGIVSDYRHVVRACTLGQAAASIMARHVEGKSVEELKHVAAAMRAMAIDSARLAEPSSIPAKICEWTSVKTGGEVMEKSGFVTKRGGRGNSACLSVRGKSHPWPFSTWATPENAEGFRGCRLPHPAAADYFRSPL